MDIHALLLKRNLTIGAAESCTGGLVAKIITDKAGSSRYFLLGVVAYSNEAKTDILGIPQAIIRAYGAVSEETARQMARAIRRLARADCGIGVTGIAGPSGGVPGKPTGTVFIAVETPGGAACKKFSFKGTRAAIRMQATHTALSMLLNQLITHNP